MALKQGAVQAVKESKTFNTKYGEKKHVNLKLDDGNFYTAQFEDADKPVRFKEGQTLEFKYSEEESNKTDNNGQPYVNKVIDKKTLEIGNGNSGGGAPATNTTAPAKPAAPAVDEKQNQIMRQSAMGYAAQIVAGTLTSKSSLDQAAQDVVDLADRFFFPYSKDGKTMADEEEEDKRTQDVQSTTSEDDPEDDLPF